MRPDGAVFTPSDLGKEHRSFRPTHPVPTLRLDAGQARPLVLYLWPRVEHVRHGCGVPGMLSPMDFYAVSQVWRLVPALGLVREVRHAAQMTAIRSNRMLPVTTVFSSL